MVRSWTRHSITDLNLDLVTKPLGLKTHLRFLAHVNGIVDIGDADEPANELIKTTIITHYDAQEDFYA